MLEAIGNVFGWMNENFLKMTWLNELVGRFIENVLGLSLTSKLGSSLQFFVYDTVKIFVLLSALIFAISYVQSYFPPERTKAILGRFDGITGMVLGGSARHDHAVLLVLVDPAVHRLHVCGSALGCDVRVPDLVAARRPRIGDAPCEHLQLDHGDRLCGRGPCARGHRRLHHQPAEARAIRRAVRLRHASGRCRPARADASRPTGLRSRGQVVDVVTKVWLYVLIGVGIGAIIHGWIPGTFISAVLGYENPFAVIIATAIGVPMYADIFGTLPIAEALVGKGVGLGTVLAFMMAVTALRCHR